MKLWRIRPGGAAAAALTGALSVALFGCASSPQGPTGSDGVASATTLTGFGWFHPGPAPGAWLRSSLSGRSASARAKMHGRGEGYSNRRQGAA